VTYEYKMIQVAALLEVKPGDEKGNEAAAYLEPAVNAYAKKGWEFWRLDEIGIVAPPGCLPSLFGQRPNVRPCYVLTFRRSLSGSSREPGERAAS
jgi:hypothetical protein